MFPLFLWHWWHKSKHKENFLEIHTNVKHTNWQKRDQGKSNRKKAAECGDLLSRWSCGITSLTPRHHLKENNSNYKTQQHRTPKEGRNLRMPLNRLSTFKKWTREQIFYLRTCMTDNSHKQMFRKQLSALAHPHSRTKEAQSSSAQVREQALHRGLPGCPSSPLYNRMCSGELHPLPLALNRERSLHFRLCEEPKASFHPCEAFHCEFRCL